MTSLLLHVSTLNYLTEGARSQFMLNDITVGKLLTHPNFILTIIHMIVFGAFHTDLSYCEYCLVSLNLFSFKFSDQVTTLCQELGR